MVVVVLLDVEVILVNKIVVELDVEAVIVLLDVEVIMIEEVLDVVVVTYWGSTFFSQ